MTIYFVSGHLDLSLIEFEEHYAQALTEAVEQKAAFVVGDARGCDHLTQQFLKAAMPSDPAGLQRVRIYHMLDAPRFNAGFPTVNGFKSDGDRDMAMTFASYEDIAWIRPGREKSGTARNISRRAKVGTPEGVTVKVRRVDASGRVIEEADAPLMRIESGMALVCEQEAAYCLAGDECGGYWNCNKDGRYRLSPSSLARCRELEGLFRKQV